MAFVGEPFRHDIFVSYSHGDSDGTGDSRLKLWSQAFVRELESELRALPDLGREVRIFLDQDHRPHQGIDPLEPLTEQLREDISRSAVLTVLMSPHYLRSRWCKDEREWWMGQRHPASLPLAGRVAVARIWNTTGPWPAPLIDERGEPLVGFCFYNPKIIDLQPQPFEWPAPGPESKGPFRENLLRLAGWIALKLRSARNLLDEERRAAEAARRLGAEAGHVVYLHARPSEAAQWEEACGVLNDSGFVVVPTEPDPVPEDARQRESLRQQRVEMLSASDALLLLGANDPRTVETDMVSIGRGDRHSAQARSQKPLPCALLDRCGPTLATPRRRQTARLLNIAWINATQPPWIPAVQEWLSSAAHGENGR